MKEFLKNYKNKFDFFVRNNLNWSLPVSASSPFLSSDEKLQKELREFLDLFDWEKILNFEAGILAVADIGARNFSFAPVYEELFEKHGFKTMLFGIEMDAHRRMYDGRTRAAYGKYFAKQVRQGSYHSIDFLQWRHPLHIAFLLHPFVTTAPLLSWGLPLENFKPSAMMKHAKNLLQPKKGILILSSPTEVEYEISLNLALQEGFNLGQEVQWHPGNSSVQKKSRFGIILRP
jgi:hypothetical protein